MVTMVSHSSTLAWRVPWMEEPGGLQSMGSLRDTTERLHFHFSFHTLEKEMATHSSVLAWRIPGMGGTWWAAVYGVAQSWTWLKQLSSKDRVKIYIASKYSAEWAPLWKIIHSSLHYIVIFVLSKGLYVYGSLLICILCHWSTCLCVHQYRIAL